MPFSYSFSYLPFTSDTVVFPSYPPVPVQMTAGSGPDGVIVGSWWHNADSTTIDAGGAFEFLGCSRTRL